MDVLSLSSSDLFTLDNPRGDEEKGTSARNGDGDGVVVKEAEADGGWSVSWCREAYWGQILAVGVGVDCGLIKVSYSPRKSLCR